MTARKIRLEPRKSPVQRRSQSTVEQILFAAAQVFETHGYAAGTTNRIAEKAGVSIGTLYQYFPSKEAVAAALLEKHIDETLRKLHEWIGHMVAEQHDLRAALRDYVEFMLEMHSGRPRLQHILLEETPLPEKVHKAMIDSGHTQAHTVAGFLRIYPEVARQRLESIGFIMVETVECLTHRFAAHSDSQLLSREAFVDEISEMLFAYLTCTPEKKIPPSKRKTPRS